MAKPSRSIGASMTSAQRLCGVFYLPVYLFALPAAIQTVSALLDLRLTALQINMTYFIINFLVIWAVFRHFLVSSFRKIHFWELVQAVILGGCLYWAGKWLLGWVVTLLGWSIPAFNDQAVGMLLEDNWWLMTAATLVLAPLVEEVLVRGVLFGWPYGKSRIGAYALSVIVFAAMHVWQYAPQSGLSAVLLAALPYVPAGIALAWTYEKGSNIWSPVVLHMLLNAQALWQGV